MVGAEAAQENQTKRQRTTTMKNMQLILGCLILAALILPLAMAVFKGVQTKSLRSFKRALGLHAGVLRCNALGDGIHENACLPFRADAAHSARHLLVARGSDSVHVAVSGATTIPLGVCTDTPGAAEDDANVRLLGAGKGTVLMVASEAMATTDVPVYAAASGKIALEGVVKVGTLRSTASADGDKCEVEPCLPTVAPNGVATVAGATLAIPVTRRVVSKTTGGVEALTLADGLPGQRLTIILATDGGDGTLTPATSTGFATIVFADAKDRAELEYIDDTTGWILLGTSGTTAPPVTT